MGLVGLIVLSVGGAIATAVGYWALSNPAPNTLGPILALTLTQI